MLDIRPMTGRIGAEIAGADLRRPVSKELAGALRDALYHHHVLVIRDQHLDHEQQKVLTQVFGPLMRSKYLVSGIEGEEDVIRVLKEPNERGGVFGGDWHSDLTFLDEPPAGSVLTAAEVPPYGGDTVWASNVAAWEALPEALRGLLDGRNAIHVGKPYGVKWVAPVEEQSGDSMRMVRGDPEADAEHAHPAVLTHPDTGRRALFLNPLYVIRLEGLTEFQSRPVLEQVHSHSTRPEFCCRVRWSAGDVVVWDNLATQHYAVNDYSGFRRLMYRTTFAGPKPA